MSVKIRLSRHGAKKRPYYRIVVADARDPRDGRFIEQVGTYDPRTPDAALRLDQAKVDGWIKQGAQPTQTVRNLMKRAAKEAAAASRRRVLDMVATDRIPMIGYHMPFPAIGYVETNGDGFRWVPESYQMML